MIGFYNYTVILTYLNLASSIVGMFCCSSGHVSLGVFFLALSGLMDAFDGKVARTKKDRTVDEKRFGIQIDSLSDIVGFGVLPVIICWHSGMDTIHGAIILVFYALAGLIRLAFYNVLEEKHNEEENLSEGSEEIFSDDTTALENPDDVQKKGKIYRGMPITSIAVGLPVIYMTKTALKGWFIWVLEFIMVLAAVLFIADFEFERPNAKQLGAIIVIVLAAVLYSLFLAK